MRVEIKDSALIFFMITVKMNDSAWEDNLNQQIQRKMEN